MSQVSAPKTMDVRGRLRRRPRRVLVVAAAAVLFSGLLAGCAGAPQAVLNVPGSYTGQFFVPGLFDPTGRPSVTVVMCLDEASAVQLDFSQSSAFSLEWNGETITEIGTSHYVTEVLQPGCGLLGFGLTPCYMFCYERPHFTTVTTSKV